MSFKEKILSHFALSEGEYFSLTKEVSYDDIPLLEGKEVDNFIFELSKLKEEKAKVLIYGDYDTDGVMATSVTYLALKEFGLNAATYLPSRYNDGYGLNLDNLQKIYKQGFKAIILVDNGITLLKEVEEAKKLGITILIIDHHTPGEVLPATPYIIHPKIQDVGIKEVSAGFMATLMSRRLLGRYDDYLFSLGAVSLISDLMPLTKMNRTAVRLLKKIIDNQPFEVFTLLKGKDEVLTYDTFKMQIIPRVNAVGRMKSGIILNRLVKYFTTDNPQERQILAKFISDTNDERKQATNDALFKLEIDENNPAIFLFNDGLEGLNGLIANRLLNLYHKPTVVFSKKENEDGLLVGSVRSNDGFNIVKAFDSVKPLLVKAGGHALSGGFSIYEKDLEEFKKQWNFLALKHLFEKNDYAGVIKLDKEDLTEENLAFYEKLEPFGPGFEEPCFVYGPLRAEDLSFTMKGQYLNTPIANNINLFSFNFVESLFLPKTSYLFYLHIKNEYFRGRKNYRLIAFDKEETK